MYDCIDKLKLFCSENKYEIISSYEDEITIKARCDMWKINAVADDKCTLLHLNSRGKMQWHRQGKHKFYNTKYIMNCIQYHNTYIKNFNYKKGH